MLLTDFTSRLTDESVDEVAAARKDIARFVEYVFRDPSGKPFKLQPFHREMLDIMANARRGLILAPRGSGKSSLASLALPCYELTRNKDARIIIVSNTLEQAKEWLRDIERTMKENERYIALAGELAPDKRGETSTWTDVEKVVRGRSPHASHLSLKAVGVKGAILGRRADLIVADDVVDSENAATPYQREQLRDWFWKVLVPVLEPHGRLIVIGTRFAVGDLYEELWKIWSRKRAGKFIYPDAKCIKIVAETKPRRSYWSERFPWAVLQERKDTDTLSWWTQYMNEPVDLTGSFLKRDWLRLFLEIPKHTDGSDALTYYVGFDPSISGKGDYCALAVAGRSPDNKIYLVDIIRQKADLERQAELVQQVADQYHPKIINVESNAAQQLMKQYLEKNTVLPIRGSQTKSDKAARMAGMSVYFQSGRVLVKGYKGTSGIDFHPDMRDFVEEWTSFPRGVNDDILDAVEKAIEAIVYVGVPAIGCSEDIDAKEAEEAADEEERNAMRQEDKWLRARRTQFRRFSLLR